MPTAASSNVPRRGFLARLSAAAAGLTAWTLTPSNANALPPDGSPNPNDPDAWIGRLTGKDRLVFHTHKDLMPGLVAARNVMSNARDFFGVPESSNSVVVATHGPAIQGMFTDDYWAKLSFGTVYKVNDRSGAPATKNPYLGSQDGFPPDANVTDLMRRGVTFLVCNVAIRNLAKKIVREGEDVDALHKELVPGILPGAIVVPDLFVAMSHAQKRGVGYIFAD